MQTKRYLIPLIVAILLSSSGIAQKEASHWYFGNRCSLDFSRGSPVVTPDAQLKAIGGSAAVSDRETGELLFYTDGRNFWNKRHEVMTNVHTLSTGCYALGSQPAIILPSEDKNLFHVFTIRAEVELDAENPTNPDCIYTTDRIRTPAGESGLNLYYSRVDMQLNGGLGNLVENSSNTLIMRNITEKLTAIPHDNGSDYWIVVHGWNNNLFHAFRLSGGNLVDEIVSAIGSVHGGYGGIYFEEEMRGEMKASPDGARISCAVFDSSRPFDLFDFDATTGSLTHYINLGDVRGQYGVSFSPDNSKLYVTSDSRAADAALPEIIVQYDLEMDTPEEIVASRKSVVVGNRATNIPRNGIFDGWSTAAKGMALAPDGRLYISGNEPRDNAGVDNILVTINNPNKRGEACAILYRTFPFQTAETAIGLPNFMQSYFNGLNPAEGCEEPLRIEVYPNPFRAYIEIGEPGGCSTAWSLQMVDMSGKLVLTENTITPGTRIDLSHVSAGIYNLIVQAGGETAVKRIVKIASP
jgi:hypothetical protein